MRTKGIFELAPGLSLILASASPRRQKILTDLGLSFTSFPVQDEPSPQENELPQKYVMRAAVCKASKCMDAVGKQPGNIILAADTCVIINSRIVGKPEDHKRASQILHSLNGKSCLVASAACLLLPSGEKFKILDEARVHFHHWPDDILDIYADTEEPLDKAGAFAVQGMGAFLIDYMEGNFTTVIGLPLPRLVQIMLKHNLIIPHK